MYPLKPQINTKISSPDFKRKPKPSLPEPLPAIVGYAFFFENIVFYATKGRDIIGMLHDKKASRYGEFLGAVKGLIPYHPYQILYQWIHSSEGYLQRKKMRSFAKKHHTSIGKLKRDMYVLRTKVDKTGNKKGIERLVRVKVQQNLS